MSSERMEQVRDDILLSMFEMGKDGNVVDITEDEAEELLSIIDNIRGEYREGVYVHLDRMTSGSVDSLSRS